MVSIFVFLDEEPEQPVDRLLMSAGQSSETANEVAFAVVVDPRPWQSSLRELAAVIEVQLDLLAVRSTASPHTPDLTTRLRVGATTVAEDMEKEEARQLLDLLIDAGVDAKLSRRARRAVPAQLPERPARPLSKRDPQTPAEHPASTTADRQPPMRATLMSGWPQSLTAPQPPTAPPVAPSHEDDSQGPATVMGWGDFIRRPLHENPSSVEAIAESKPPEEPAAASPAESPPAPERAFDEDEARAPEKIPFPFGVDSEEVEFRIQMAPIPRR